MILHSRPAKELCPLAVHTARVLDTLSLDNPKDASDFWRLYNATHLVPPLNALVYALREARIAELSNTMHLLRFSFPIEADDDGMPTKLQLITSERHLQLFAHPLFDRISPRL